MQHHGIFLLAIAVFSQTNADIKVVGGLGSYIGFEKSGLESLSTFAQGRLTKVRYLTTNKVINPEDNDCCEKCKEKFGKEKRILYQFHTSFRSRSANCYCRKPKSSAAPKTKETRSIMYSVYSGKCGGVAVDGALGLNRRFEYFDTVPLSYSYRSKYRVPYIRTTGATPVKENDCCDKCGTTFVKELGGVSPLYEFRNAYRGSGLCYCKKIRPGTGQVLTKAKIRIFSGSCDAKTEIIVLCAKLNTYTVVEEKDQNDFTDVRSWEECGKSCQKLGDICKAWMFSMKRTGGGRCYTFKTNAGKRTTASYYSTFISGDSSCPK